MKLNLGSGPSGINGWINMDWGMLPLMSKMPYVRKLLINLGLLPASYDIVWPSIKLVDIRKALPLADSSVDYIYCSHVLEHFEKWEVVDILKESKRVLKKRGLIRIVLPDLEKVINKYSDADQFCREFYGYHKDVKNWSNSMIRGHQWMYDKKSFAKVLTEIGFKDIEFKTIGISKMPDVKLLDLKIHEELSMYIEARK